MARKCTICGHPKRTEIEKALISGLSLQNIAIQFSVEKTAVFRHGKKHLPKALAKVQKIKEELGGNKGVAQAMAVAEVIETQAATEQANADIVMAELGKCIERVNLLCNACDEYLRDPDNPARYNIGPRATDVNVIYLETAGEGESAKQVRRKRKLSDILADLQGHGFNVAVTEIKHADIRELIIKVLSESRAQLEFLTNLEILNNNVLQSRLFVEELFQFLDEQSPGMSQQFFNRVREKKMIRSMVAIPAIGGSNEIV